MADAFDTLAESGTVTTLDRRDDMPGVVTLTIDRPEARNALNDAVRAEVIEAMDTLGSMDGVRVIVLTGSDAANAFVAGADVTDLQNRDPMTHHDESDPPRIYEAIADAGVPVIARINGPALGGGCEVAQACDIRLASTEAVLGQPEVTLGLMPGGGGTQRLPRLVGVGQALRLILSGEVIDAEEAADIGLIEGAYPPDELDDRVYDLAERIASNGPRAVAFARRAVRAAAEQPLSSGLQYEKELFSVLFDSADVDEGIEAFLEDREPDWQDA